MWWFMCGNKSRWNVCAVGCVWIRIFVNIWADVMNIKQWGAYLYVHVCKYEMSNWKPQHKNHCTRHTFCLHLLTAVAPSLSVLSYSCKGKNVPSFACIQKGLERARLSVTTEPKNSQRWWLMSRCKCWQHFHIKVWMRRKRALSVLHRLHWYRWYFLFCLFSRSHSLYHNLYLEGNRVNEFKWLCLFKHENQPRWFLLAHR